jgi:hypothetical protein
MAKGTGSPQKVNPALLVVLGIVLVGAAVYHFTTSSETKPKVISSSSSIQTETPVSEGIEEDSLGKKTNDTEDVTQEESLVNKVMSFVKNPFLVPEIYRKKPMEVGGSEAPELQKDSPELLKKQEEMEADMEPRLGGIFKKRLDTVALIYYNKHGFILRENDRIPESEYVMKRIASDNVVLISNNGTEKVLKLRSEKP